MNMSALIAGGNGLLQAMELLTEEAKSIRVCNTLNGAWIEDEDSAGAEEDHNQLLATVKGLSSLSIPYDAWKEEVKKAVELLQFKAAWIKESFSIKGAWDATETEAIDFYSYLMEVAKRLSKLLKPVRASAADIQLINAIKAACCCTVCDGACPA
jgi:hypothetical protein